MNRNESYGRSRRDRSDRDYGRQSEQFADSDYRYGDDNRQYGQMGESGGPRDNYGQSDNDAYSGYGYGGSAGRYSNNREDQRGYNRGEGGADRERSDYGRQGAGFSGGGYSASRGGSGSSVFGNRDSGGFGSFNSNDFGGRDFAGPERSYGGYSASDRYGSGGSGSGFAGGASSGGAFSGGSRGGYSGHRGDDDRGHERGFFDRAGDTVASWFGDEDAARRREMDHSGRGPTNYTRSDERILEDACDRLTDDRAVDAQNIQVTVQNGEITLDGTVSSRQQKRRAEDCVEDLSGVKHVQNNLRVQDRSGENQRSSSDQSTQTSFNRSDSTTGTLA